jgi:hypothetical protein
VSYSRLDFKDKSIRSFFAAAEGKDTLAMGNLAHVYVGAGFVEDAQNLIDKANKLSNEGYQIDPRIGEAQKTIKILLEEEGNKEEGILLEANKESQYRVKYANSLCSDRKITKSQIEGTWQTSLGNLPLIYEQETGLFKIEHKKQTEEISYWTGKPAKWTKEENISINGTVKNMSGKYTIDVSNEALTPSKTVYNAEGYMIINENCDFIEIMEKNSDGKTNYEQRKKMPISTIEADT